MNRLGPVSVCDSSPIRIMGILNLSPESFFKKSIKTADQGICNTINQMENDGVDIIDIGGMSTAPYLSTMITEKEESRRLIKAIKIIQKISNLPISVDTCRSNVAKDVLELGVEIINDVTGLKYDSKILKVLEKYQPSLVLCAFNKKTIVGNQVTQTKKLLKESISLARSANIPKNKITLDPAIGFFRNMGIGPFFTKIKSNWKKRDLLILQNLKTIKQNFPLLVSVSQKSFLGHLLNEPNPQDRISGSLACEVLSVLNGANIIRTHNIRQTKQVVTIAHRLFSTNKSL